MNPSEHSTYPLDPEKLRSALTDGPGVYQFRDPLGHVLYVGKAKSLKKRVLSYFRSRQDLGLKTALMMERASGLDVFLTATEKESFILERSLIREWMPRYNIVLRDDKHYPILRLSIADSYPRLNIVRRIKKDGAIYFGPFSSAMSVRNTLKAVGRVFKLRRCKGSEPPKRDRPCLNYQMARCLGPCALSVSVPQYQETVRHLILFLEGRNTELLGQLRQQMQGAAEALDFEKAGLLRDKIRAIERTVEPQHVVSHRLEDQDVIGLAQTDEVSQLVVLFVRKGYVTGSRNYLFTQAGERPEEIMEAFLKQYYPDQGFIPKTILISSPVEDADAIGAWLSDLSGERVVIQRPHRGQNLKLIHMALENAENLLSGYSGSQKQELIRKTQSALSLRRPPRVIEGLDISTIQGDMAVGTVVCFVEGEPEPSRYRNVRIRTGPGMDDYGMMAELAGRRLSRPPWPDLLLVDGGKGHLSAVRRVLEERRQELGATNEAGDLPELVSIAKPEEEKQEKWDKIYVLERKNPLNLRFDDPVLHLLMRIRDEAHRRAISYHRKLKRTDLTRSRLDQTPGIGALRKRALLRHFKDVHSISEATVEELAHVPGMNRKVAGAVRKALKTPISLDMNGTT